MSIKINIAASNRFHLLDLARELSAKGYDVRFYSFVPTHRCKQFGIKIDDCRSFFWLVAPFFVISKIISKKYSSKLIDLRNRLMDWYLSHFMRKCNLFIGLGTVYVRAFVAAKRKWEATTILEWGSKHIDEQVKNSGNIGFFSNENILRSRQGYTNADYISIASTHVKNSFLKHSIPIGKLIINPYGVNLNNFHPTEYTGEYDIIMVGRWSRTKGCDFIVELCRLYHYRFLHVGGFGDMEFPSDVEGMVHHNAVNELELEKFYAKAKIFLLPSRTEGLALVQAQAIACGLPIVCSPNTGGSDLNNLLEDKSWIFEFQSYTVDDINHAVKCALDKSKNQTGLRNYAGDSIKNLSWSSYGERYVENLKLIDDRFNI